MEYLHKWKNKKKKQVKDIDSSQERTQTASKHVKRCLEVNNTLSEILLLTYETRENF